MEQTDDPSNPYHLNILSGYSAAYHRRLLEVTMWNNHPLLFGDPNRPSPDLDPPPVILPTEPEDFPNWTPEPSPPPPQPEEDK